jgi:hypothetical protein
MGRDIAPSDQIPQRTTFGPPQLLWKTQTRSVHGVHGTYHTGMCTEERLPPQVLFSDVLWPFLPGLFVRSAATRDTRKLCHAMPFFLPGAKVLIRILRAMRKITCM